MADTEESLRLTIDTGSSEKTVGELRDELRSLNDQINQVEKGSDQYKKLVQRLGEVRGEVRDVRDEMIAFNPELRAQAFARVGSALAGGFQLATGAMALLGTESKDVEKALLKVQAATALAQGIQSVMELGKAFDILKEIMLANPILTIATVITTAAVAIGIFTSEEEKAVEVQKDLNEELKKTVELMQGFGRAALGTDEVLGRLQTKTKTTAITTSELEKALADLKEQQKNVTEENQTYVAVQDDKIKNEKEFNDFAKQAAKEEHDDIQKSIDLINKELGARATVSDALKKELEARKTSFETIPSLTAAAVEESNKKMIASDKAFTDAQKEQADERARYAKIKIDDITAAEQAAHQQRMQIADAGFNGAVQIANALTNLQNARLAADLQAAGSNEKLKSKLIIEHAKKQKRIQLALAIIDTAKAVTMALASLPPPASYIAAGAAAVAGAIQIAAIQKTPLPEGGDEGIAVAASTNVQGGGSSAPTPQFRGQGTETNTNQQGEFTRFQGQLQPVFRTYVVESEITQSQTLNKKIKESATYP